VPALRSELQLIRDFATAYQLREEVWFTFFIITIISHCFLLGWLSIVGIGASGRVCQHARLERLRRRSDSSADQHCRGLSTTTPISLDCDKSMFYNNIATCVASDANGTRRVCRRYCARASRSVASGTFITMWHYGIYIKKSIVDRNIS
jgi:hypothetical protein